MEDHYYGTIAPLEVHPLGEFTVALLVMDHSVEDRMVPSEMVLLSEEV